MSQTPDEDATIRMLTAMPSAFFETRMPPEFGARAAESLSFKWAVSQMSSDEYPMILETENRRI
jgi:hypothetical protein